MSNNNPDNLEPNSDLSPEYEDQDGPDAADSVEDTLEEDLEEDLADSEESPKKGRRPKKETPLQLQAFEDYYALGPKRSLQDLADHYAQVQANPGLSETEKAKTPNVGISGLKKWSKRFDWQDRVQTRMDEERAALSQEAIVKRRKAAERRTMRAQSMQAAAHMILQKAKLDTLSIEQARKLLPLAMQLMKQGMEWERLELGEQAATYVPPKQLSEMTDAELADYIAKLSAAQTQEGN